MHYDDNTIMARMFFDAARISRSLAAQIGPLLAAVAKEIANEPDRSLKALESSVIKPSAAFSSQDVARSVYREAASQCELAASSLEDICSCSGLQQQQFHVPVHQKGGGCLDQYVFRVPKHVSMARLCDAWAAVAAASPILRTRIVSLRQEGICQVIVKGAPGWNEEASLSEYLQWDKEFRIRYGGPLCRFGEVVQPDGRKYFVLSLHPAVYDLWTLNLILDAVRKAYNHDLEPPTLFPSFSGYVRHLSGRQSEHSPEHFRRVRPGWSEDASLQFPPVPHAASEADLSNSKSLDMSIPNTGYGNGEMPRTDALLHAAWALCLSRRSGDGKACFGMHVNGRGIPLEGIAQMNGPIASIVPCDVDLATLTTGDSLLGAVHEQLNAVTLFLHTSSSIETSADPAVGTRPQSFRNILIVDSGPAPLQDPGSPEVLELVQTRLAQSSFDGARLVTRCRMMPHMTLRIEMQYDKQIISSEDIDILMEQYRHAILQLLFKASSRLLELDPVSTHERSLILDWNRKAPKQVDTFVQNQIRDAAERQPTAPAICSWDHHDLDYGQLDDLSDRMAALLQEKGIKAGIRVPFFHEKSAAAVVVMIGILKAGGSLVAIDLDHPAQRLATRLTDMGASTVVTSSALSERVNAKVRVEDLVIVDMERIRSLPRRGPAQVVLRPSDLCYITYTSGTTSKPKAIALSHSNFATSVHHNRALFAMTAATRTLQFSNFVFDMAMYEIFMTLVSGGCVCLPEEAERLNDCPGAIQRMRANYAMLSPSVATVFGPSEVPSLRTLCLGGEPFPRYLVERWRDLRLVNVYGPSETTVISSLCPLLPNSGKHHLNIGHPVTCRYWVVNPDDHNQLVPIGCTGELLIQGPVVAQGYLGDAERTRNAFIEPPTWTSDFESLDLSSRRWYKTGDLVIQTADGSVVITGRKGTQMKLAGQWIELGEIEHHLSHFSMHGWKLVAELIRPSGQDCDPCLAVFFVVPSLAGEPSGPETPCEVLPPLAQEASSILKQATVSALPKYMVPRYYICLNRIPLTNTGKTDRLWLRKLGTMLTPERLSAYTGLEDGTKQEVMLHEDTDGEEKGNPEGKLKKLWARELGLPVDRINANENFFKLGGTSIRAMRLVNAAHRLGLALTVKDVFEKPVLSDIAAMMRSVASGAVSSKDRGPSLTPQASRSFSTFTAIGSSFMTCLTQLGFLTDNIESVAAATDLQAEMAASTELDGETYYST